MLTTPVMEKAPLAVQLGIGDDGQIIFKANAVREPPHRTARADEIPELPGTVQRSRIVIITTGRAGGLHKPPWGMFRAEPIGSSNGLPIAQISRACP